MTYLKKVLAVGHLVDDPHSTTTAPGTKGVSFTLSTGSESPEGRRGFPRQRQALCQVEVRDSLADVVSRTLTAGAAICIEGQVTDRNFQGTGPLRTLVTKVRLLAFQLLEPAARDESTHDRLDPLAAN